tara:strand:- start:253 stop:498 length:246 start_codon:yes stop_codon:yes gene_type:complete
MRNNKPEYWEDIGRIILDKGLDNICIHGCLPCKTKKEHMKYGGWCKHWNAKSGYIKDWFELYDENRLKADLLTIKLTKKHE